jgi:hypothetical protein
MCGRYYRRSDKQRIAEAFKLGKLLGYGSTLSQVPIKRQTSRQSNQLPIALPVPLLGCLRYEPCRRSRRAPAARA